jgi:hypothetical protein
MTAPHPFVPFRIDPMTYRPGRTQALLPPLVTALVACAFAAACGGGADTVETVALQGRAFTDSTAGLGLPIGLLDAAGVLVVQDAHPSPALRLFDAQGRQLASTGRGGSGPGEFTAPLDVFGRPSHPAELWVYDQRLARLTAYDARSASTGTVAMIGEPVTLATPVLVEAPRWLDDSTLVALTGMGQMGERRFSLYGADGARRETAGDPPPGDETTRPFVRQQAYGGKIAVHPGQPWFVLASRYAGRLEVFDRAGASVRRMEVPDAFEPDYSPAPDGLNMERGPGFRFGYIDVAATADHVLGLFSGRLGTEPDPNFASTVHVFGWDGRLLRILTLDVSAFRIAPSHDGRTLYAIVHDPEPGVVAYDLTSALP